MRLMANESVSSTGVAPLPPPPPAAKPPVMSPSPVRRVAGDLAVEWKGRGRYPPGPGGNTVTRTLKMARDPLPILLGGYEEYGPIFTLRLLHTKVVFMLGPEANHYVTVSHPENFHWRESSFGDLIPLLGDGLLTIDEDYHDQVRATMMPAFHREQVAASVEAMIDEATPAIEMLRSGEIVDIYEWMRRLAMRIAMRALLGLDPDEAGKGAAAAEYFERALEFYGIDFALRFLRGPGSPWRKMLAARKVLDEIVFTEIAHRRQSPDSGRMDVLSLLLDVRDEAGEGFSDREVRDQLMTLMFAGHDTSTSTLTFLMYELARRPDVIEKLQEEQDRVLGGGVPDIEKLEREMPYLDQVLDEVLRLYPPAWIGPRRAVKEFEFNGHTVPDGAYLNYCSWASHRIPEFFPEPEAFRPERFTRERKAALPRGAYVPFGGGKRICIGKRFGQIEVKLVATMLLQRMRLDLLPGRTMTVRQMPTLSPKGGLKMRVLPRG
jgi:cytochrome P450